MNLAPFATSTDIDESQMILFELACSQPTGDDQCSFCPHCGWQDEDYNATPRHGTACIIVRARRLLGYDPDDSHYEPHNHGGLRHQHFALGAHE